MSSFFHRSLSPNSFERLRNENSEYFYKPKRGPSVSKSNIVITRPIKTFELTNKFLTLLGKETKAKTENFLIEQIKPIERKSTSNSMTFLSLDDAEFSSSKSSKFSSRTNSSVSAVNEPTPIQDERQISPRIDCRTPAIGINVTTNEIHLVLIELYPQNVDYSTFFFQRYLLSLIVEHEHKTWSLNNIILKSTFDQEGNFRLFTLKHDEFDRILLHLQSFVTYNCSMNSSFVLNIALTGEQTKEYEMKIGSRLNKINLNFDLIPCRAESYMIAFDYFLSQTSKIYDDELIELSPSTSNSIDKTSSFYPYILIHVEVGSTFFYVVHSSTQYSLISSTNLAYKTFENLFRFVQPGVEDLSKQLYAPSFDTTSNDLCKHCRRSSSSTLTSFTRIPSRYFPSDYALSKPSQFVYRGWTNRRNSSYDVPTQTDDSFLEMTSIQTRLAMRRSLLTMFTMNIAVIFKLIQQIYPTVRNCLFIGEVFQLESDFAQNLTNFLRSNSSINVFQLRRESLIGALGCALPRVYFDVINDHDILGHDCIY